MNCELIYDLAGRIADRELQLGVFTAIATGSKSGQRRTAPAPTCLSWLRTRHYRLAALDASHFCQPVRDRAGWSAATLHTSAVSPPQASFFLVVADNQHLDPALTQRLAATICGFSVLANQSASASQRPAFGAASVGSMPKRFLKWVASHKHPRFGQLLTQVGLVQSRFGYYHVQIFLVEHAATGRSSKPAAATS
jgi:hypothetical protein